jgi:putative peptide zinc metalloprotease protein
VNDSIFSPSWYRVAQLRPALRSHVRFHRHLYRGERWYVVEDPTTGRSHRLSATAFAVVGLLDGRRTMQGIWEAAAARLGDEVPTQDESIRLLGLLHGADLLRCDVSPDTLEMWRRTKRRERSTWWRHLLNPLSVRIPLLDPDELLERWLPWARPLFTRASLLLGSLLVATAAVLAVVHWSELTSGAATELLDPRNLLIVWIVFPVVKALHELAHGFATRLWGGEVHEMGILLLVFVPVPYVDASSASAFESKWKRIGVGAAGIVTELLLSSLALLVWLAVEPGLVRTVAWNVIRFGGASSLLFYGNPLLRFDGYYVLQDWIESPNLARRSQEYLAWWVQDRVFGLEQVRRPVMASGEAPWLACYCVASFVYRLGVLFAIALYVAGRFFVVGVGLAILALTLQIGVPLLRQIVFVLTSARVGPRRTRALGVSLGTAATAAALLLMLPLPLHTRAEGVVIPPEGAHVRAGAAGFVVETLVEPGDPVLPGQPLARTRDPSLETELAVLKARLRGLRAQHTRLRRANRASAEQLLPELRAAQAELSRARERAGESWVRSPAKGRFVPLPGAELTGRLIEQGDLLGYVVDETISTARVVVPQADAALVRGRTRRVEVRLSRQPSVVWSAQIERDLPALAHLLPSAALGTQGGGRFPVDPVDPQGLRTLEPLYQLELSLPDGAGVREIGGRVFVRFDHGAEPVAWRSARAVRRLFLGRLGV